MQPIINFHKARSEKTTIIVFRNKNTSTHTHTHTQKDEEYNLEDIDLEMVNNAISEIVVKNKYYLFEVAVRLESLNFG